MSKTALAEYQEAQSQYKEAMKGKRDKAIKQFVSELETAKDTLVAFEGTDISIDEVLGLESVKELLKEFRVANKTKGKPRFTDKKALRVLANGALSIEDFAKAMKIKTAAVTEGVKKYKDKLAIADGKVKLK